MRLQQLRCLTDEEKGLLLYVMNDFGNRTPTISSVDEIVWYKNEAILWRLSQAQTKLNESGKPIFMELMRKLNTSAHQEVIEFAEKNKSEYTQLEFKYD